MTYNEWRDELKNNLLSVSDGERRRVLDYYAEAYADRREAGFTEREIIEDFGAPYDAAQRILAENYDEEVYSGAANSARYTDRQESRHQARREERWASRGERHNGDDYYNEPQSQPQNSGAKAKKREDYTWLFVLLCVIFAAPLFGLVMGLVGVSIGLCVAPFGALAMGIFRVFAGIGLTFSNVASGFMQIGLGLIQTGVGLALIPLCIWLVKTIWRLFRKFFAWVRRLFSGKEDVQ